MIRNAHPHPKGCGFCISISDIKNWPKGVSARAASLHGIQWIELNVQPEHVQGTAKIPLNMLPSTALQFLKGISARLFFLNAPNFRKRYSKGHLWSRGKYAASLGIFQLEERNEYVRNQDKHHGTVWVMEE